MIGFGNGPSAAGFFVVSQSGRHEISGYSLSKYSFLKYSFLSAHFRSTRFVEWMKYWIQDHGPQVHRGYKRL